MATIKLQDGTEVKAEFSGVLASASCPNDDLDISIPGGGQHASLRLSMDECFQIILAATQHVRRRA